MVKNGETVEVGGVTATVETSWGQGRHRMYRLSDGREILDLQELVKTGAAKIIPSVVKNKTWPDMIPNSLKPKNG